MFEGTKAPKIDVQKYKKHAEQWLEQKFNKEEKQFKFKHKQDMDETDKTYDVSINNVEFRIAGKEHETPEDDLNTVVYKILPNEEQEEDNKGF